MNLNSLLSRKGTRQLVKYLIVGSVNTLLAYLFFYFLVTLHVHYQLALFIVTAIVIIHSYFWHSKWTFKSKSSKRFYEFLRFNSTYSFTFFLNMFLLFLSVEKFKFDPRLAQIYCMIISTFINFIGHKYWSFKS